MTHAKSGSNIGRLTFHALASLVFSSLLMLGTASLASAQDDVMTDLVERVIDSVVHISTANRAGGPGKSDDSARSPDVPEGFEDFFERFGLPEGFRSPGEPGEQGAAPRSVQSAGSGFVIDESGIIVTSATVVGDDVVEISATFEDGTELPAKILGRDAKTDIAVLKVTPDRPLKYVEFGDSSDLLVGQTVVAIGSPFGLGASVSIGVVSALHRNIGSGPYDDFIQTDAAINRGNSGGPLFDPSGEVIGVVHSIYSPTGGSIGIGFATPSNLVKDIVAQLRAFGEVQRGWLGVRIQSVTEDIAISLGMEQASGALVAKVETDSPAEAAGMAAGDVILSFDGSEIADPQGLSRTVAATEIGKVVDVEIMRDRQMQILTVAIAPLPGTTAPPPAVAKPELSLSAEALLGLTVDELTEATRAEHGIDESLRGVVVAKVGAGSEAERKGLKVGEVVVQLGQDEVTSPEQFVAKLNEERRSGRDVALLRVVGKTGPRFVGLRLTGR